MAPITLPPTFHNSFWSADYRTGLETLFKQLDKGCIENKDIIAFIQSQAKANGQLASVLQNPPISSLAATSSGGASLQHTLLSLTGASSARGQAHETLSKELEDRVLAPFRAWSEAHEARVKKSREDELGKSGVIKGWETSSTEVAKLKQAYMAKSRAADDAEDDAKFAPTSAGPAVPSKLPSDIYTHSPKKPSLSGSNKDVPESPKPLRRSGTVNDRISAKLRAASISRLPPPPSEMEDDDDMKEEPFVPPTQPGEMPRPITHVQAKERAIPGSPMPSSPPPPVLLSGLSLPQAALRSLLEKLEHHLQTTPPPYSAGSSDGPRTRSKTTILGTYNNTASGEEIVEWLVENIEGLGGDWERAEEAAASIMSWGLMARIGVGREFEPTGDSHYVLKLSNAPESPLSATANANFPSLLRSYLPSALSNNSDEPVHIRARREARKADEDYKNGVKKLENTRLALEERLEHGLRVWEKWEKERGGVVKTVLKQYEDAIAKLAPRLAELQTSTSLSIEAYHPDADLVALIEGNRTGPFRPHPHVYESLDQEHPDVAFGIDLRKWSGEQGWRSMVNAPQRPKGAIPDVLVALFQSLDDMYVDLPHEERRRSWIYEVPLKETHQLRAQLNDPSSSVQDLVDAIKKFNVPIVCGTLKLFLLELSPPVMGWEGWQDAKSIYPHIGADQTRDKKEDVGNVLGRLPSIQLYVLDALVGHLSKLISSTKSDEDNDLYITKLALSLGRTVLRPQYESELTIQDRTASLFFADLIHLYSDILPQLVERKKRESERVMPTRKRTTIVDQRISRSSLTDGADPQELLGLQHLKQNPPRSSSPEPSSAPPAPIAEEQTQASVEEQSTVPATAPLTTSYDLSAQDKVIASGAANLSRTGSGETSRLRGPRGARGPRPPPTRVVSHTATASQGSIEAPTAASPVTPASESEARPTPTRVADPSEYKPHKKQASGSAGMFRARPGSVGQAIANFEKSRVEE